MNAYKIIRISEHLLDVLVGIYVKRIVKKSSLEHGINIEQRRKTKIILSLTTYNKRYKTIGLTLKSLLLQTVKPDKIIVWLDDDIPENRITEEMKGFEKYGIEYRHTNLNIKPHNKYYHAMCEFPNDIIITVDDDIIYPKSMIEELINTYEEYPNSVCARRVHLMTFDSDDNLKKYNDWKYEYRKSTKPSHLLCATGVSGVLYPPHALPKEAFNVDNIKELSLNADDIWLKVMEIKNDVKVVWAKNHLVLPPLVKNSQTFTLNSTNVLQNENDIYIQKLQEKYPEVFAYLVKYKK